MRSKCYIEGKGHNEIQIVNHLFHYMKLHILINSKKGHWQVGYLALELTHLTCIVSYRWVEASYGSMEWMSQVHNCINIYIPKGDLVKGLLVKHLKDSNLQWS
jgi:hypothetical protein